MPEGECYGVAFGMFSRDGSTITARPAEDADDGHFVGQRALKTL